MGWLKVEQAWVAELTGRRGEWCECPIGFLWREQHTLRFWLARTGADDRCVELVSDDGVTYHGQVGESPGRATMVLYRGPDGQRLALIGESWPDDLNTGPPTRWVIRCTTLEAAGRQVRATVPFDKIAAV
jgi:hypothetical protein